ncbi:PAS domain-containing protein, partial [bacterium]
MRLIISFIFVFLGVLIGILLVPYIRATGIQIILGVGMILMLMMVYLAVRMYVVRQRDTLKISGGDKKQTEVGFVVDTFQELVGKLKEKEKELEGLRARAEDRAVRMETYNENILQSVPSGVVSIDNSMKIKSINQSAERMLGVKAGDIIDKDCAEVFSEPLLGIVKDNRNLYRGEYLYATRDKRRVWLGVTTSQLKNAADETIGLILVFTDLSDVKTLQAQVELKQRLTQLGEMSAGIAHELRNPMSVVAGYTKLLSKKVEDQDKTTVSAILTEIENMDRIISELLAFAKPTDVNKVPVDLRKIMEDAVVTAADKNSHVRVSLQGTIPEPLLADEVLLRQAFTNLFRNAYEAMSDEGTLTIDLQMSKDRAEIEIKDTGDGIPDESKQKIFLPFYTSKEKGIGLGLAIVQKVIISHGGSIDVESREGEGTTFRITLPV